MRILVVGLPKSGTTILTYRIAGALDGVHIDFEPTGGPAPVADAATGHIITKKLVGAQTSDLGDYRHYDRRIWISRDPRDFLVSQTLYRWHREQPPRPDDQAWFERILSLVIVKEADPRAVAFADLEPADYGPSFDAVAELWTSDADDGWLLYRYEDMVAGRYDELNRYLGFPVVPEASVARGLERVVRRRGTGDWRHWFTPADVERHAAGAMARYMEVFGYDHDDWALDPHPTIDPAHGSAYMTGLFNDHRRHVGQGDSPAPGNGSAIDPEPGPEPEPALDPVPDHDRESEPDVASVRGLKRLLGRR
jgi:hypothetical protein